MSNLSTLRACWPETEVVKHLDAAARTIPNQLSATPGEIQAFHARRGDLYADLACNRLCDAEKMQAAAADDYATAQQWGWQK